MNLRDRTVRSMAACAGISLALTGCVVSPTHEAPIVERSQTGAASAKPAAPPMARQAHDGQYVVQAGDTLYSIAQAFGQDYRDIARWNGLDQPAQLRVGQTLRIEPVVAPQSGATTGSPSEARSAKEGAPAVEDSSASQAETVPVPVPSSALETRPLAPSFAPSGASEGKPSSVLPSAPAPEAGAAAPSFAPSGASEGKPSSTPLAGAPEGLPSEARSAKEGSALPDIMSEKPLDRVPDKASEAAPEAVWAWPTAGKVLDRFDQTGNKGIDIAGNIGDPVWAANDGQVVYSGSGLRGYGKLVIIKHTDEFVSAYANNNEVLVTQGQAVKRGQRIADLGTTDAPSPRLHFEIRRRGKPVDPLTYLPSR
jgi:lipoprotein NlpD